MEVNLLTGPSTLALGAEGVLGRPRCVGKRPPSSKNSGTSASRCRSSGAANGPECFARSLARNSESTTRLTPVKPRRQLTTSALATATRAFQGDGFATSETNAPAQLASGPRDLADASPFSSRGTARTRTAIQTTALVAKEKLLVPCIDGMMKLGAREGEGPTATLPGMAMRVPTIDDNTSKRFITDMSDSNGS